MRSRSRGRSSLNAPGGADAPITGTGANAYRDYPTAWTNWSPTCQSSSHKPMTTDLVYSYTPTVSGPFTVSVAATSFDSLVWFNTGTCGDASTCGAIVDSGYGNESLSVTGAAGTTYYFYVTSYTDSLPITNFTIKVY